MSEPAPGEPLAFDLELVQQHGHAFDVRFIDSAAPALRVDEPPPLGHDEGPNATRLLATAVGHCLSASLLFCLQNKFRNAQGRLRVGRIDVSIRLGDAPGTLKHLGRCLARFENLCTDTESLRQGIAVGVRVFDAQGQALFDSEREAEAAT
jgi:hypothetical protein